MGPSHRSASAASSVARNSLYGLLALGIDKAAFMGVALALARILGPADFGRYTFVLTYVAIFQIVADLGVEMILVRHIAQQPADRDRLFGSGLGLRLASGAACWLIAILLVPLLSDSTYVPLTAVAGAALVGTASQVFRVLYRVSLRIDYLLVQMSFNAVGTALLVAASLMSGHAVLGALTATSVASLVTLVLAVWLGRRLSSFEPRWEPERWRALVRESLPLGVNAILVNLTFRIGPLVLIRLSGATDVAYFGAASKLVEALCLLPEVPMLTIFPLMSVRHREGEQRFRSVSRAALIWIVLITMPAIITVGGVAGPLLRLMYGSQFGEAVPILELLAWATIFAASGAVWTGVLTVLQLQRWLLRSYAVATAVNLFAAIVLTPRYGSFGAGIATVLGAFASQLMLAWLPDTAAYTRPAVFAVLPAVAFGLAGACLTRFYVASPFLGTALALAIYAGAVIATGALGPEERAFAVRLLRTAGGGEA